MTTLRFLLAFSLFMQTVFAGPLLPPGRDRDGYRDNITTDTIQPGTYVPEDTSQHLWVEVSPSMIYPGRMQIMAEERVDEKDQFIQFDFDLATSTATRTLGTTYTFTTDSVVDNGTIRTFKMHHGNWHSPHEMRVEMSVHMPTGELVSLSARTRVATYSLPNGWHSGPLRHTVGAVACGSLLRALGVVEPNTLLDE